MSTLFHFSPHDSPTTFHLSSRPKWPPNCSPLSENRPKYFSSFGEIGRHFDGAEPHIVLASSPEANSIEEIKQVLIYPVLWLGLF
eukprot:3324060-Rhodomonas_salina.1